MVELPEMPSEDHDFTPDLARKIIAQYQAILATKEVELQAAVKERDRLAATLQLHAGDVLSLSGEVETFRSHLDDANTHAQELEARNRELEAGLRAFADPGNWVVNGRFDPHGGGFDATSFARALLSKGGNHDQ